MFEKITPEEAGVSSEKVYEFLDYLERRGLVMHSVLLGKGDALFCEAYWAPFDKDTTHRMYSETKSYTAIAIGLLEEEGKLSLDDTVASHFPELVDRVLPPALAEQTLRDMLLMKTAGLSPYWFTSPDKDRTHLYLNENFATRRPNTIWEYDSAGSQVLGSLVDKLAGKPLFEYLDEKIFSSLGTFRTAEILKTKNGDSWGDSAMVCTSRDMLSFGRFLMNGGTWNGKRLMNEAYIKTACSRLGDNDTTGFYSWNNHGYGYQMWCFEEGFGFSGMGGQYTVCIPERDLIFVCTGDNQGNLSAGSLIMAGLFDYIVRPSSQIPLPPAPAAVRKAEEYAASLKLAAAYGEPSSPFMEELDGAVYACEENRMGIREFSFHFNREGGGEFHYTNAQGKKVLPFGLGTNVFTEFPQLGYANSHGGVPTTNGFRYRCASSVAFAEEKKIRLRVQVIDRYLGNLTGFFCFRDGDVTVRFVKTAEDFFDEYYGDMLGHKR